MDILRKYAWYGFAVVASFAVAMALLFAGPAGTARAIVQGGVTIGTASASLATNGTTGTGVYTPISNVVFVEALITDMTNPGGGFTIAAPAGWQFKPAPGELTATFSSLGDVSATSIASVTATLITVNVTVGAQGTLDTITVSGISARPISDATAVSPVNGVFGIGSGGFANITGLTAITLTAAGATHVNVETAADGSGTVVPSQSIASGATVTGYAISRDASNVFVANVAGTWSLTPKTGIVANGDLVPAGDAKSAVFTGHGFGTAVIHVTSGALTPGDSGTITVPAPPAVYVPPVPAPTPVPTKVTVFLPLVPLAGVAPVIVPVPATEACPPGSVVVPPVVIPPGVGEVALPPVEVPPGTVLVCVPVVAPPGAVLVVVPQVAPRPAATGNGGLAEDRHASTPLWPVGLLVIGAATFAVAARRLVPARSKQ